MIRKLVATVAASGVLLVASAGIASAKAESWSGKKPAVESWS